MADITEPSAEAQPTQPASDDEKRERRARALYRKVESLDPVKHATLGLASPWRYEFARNTNALPINAVEFIPAARHYPILFTGDDRSMPVVLLGIRQHQNLFVDGEGAWAEGCHVPAVARRYPFLIRRKDEGRDFTLCIDVGSDLVSNGSERPLFVDGEPTKLASDAAKMCVAYARQQIPTRSFVNALKENDLLVSRNVDLKMPKGERIEVRGFKVIDDKKLRELPSEVVSEWWPKGWGAAAYAQIVSMGNFGRLLYRARRADD